MAAQSKAPSKAKTAANAIVFVVLICLGLVALNIIGGRAFKRADITQDKIYTLSPASKQLVANLPDRLTVKAFISSDLQPPFAQTAQYLRDLLDEYAAASKGKLKWEAIDPSSSKDAQQEAEKYKVPKKQRGRVSSTKIEIGETWLGVAFDYQGNIESIPEVNAPEGLEFQISSIIKLLTVKKRKIAFATSEGELKTDGDPRQGGGGLQAVKFSLRDFDTVNVQLNQGAKPIPDDVDALIVAGPRAQFSDRAQFVIDQFLMRGKSVVFLVDGMTIQAPRQMQIPGMDQPRIGQHNEGVPDALLEAYGIKVRDDIVMEPRQNAPGPVPVGGQVLLANYPAFIVATKIDEKSTILAGLRGAILPFASSLELTKDKQPGLTWTPLISSTADAWRQSGFFLFDPQAQLKPTEDRGPFVLAYAATGKLKSAYAGKPYPNEKGEKVPPPDANVSLPPGEERPLDESQGSVRIAVIGDSQFTADDYVQLTRYFQPYQAGLQLSVNAIDWASQDELLAQVRAKGVDSRPLTIKSESTPSVVKYANIVGVPLAFILFGILRWRLRTARRRVARL